MVYVAFLRGINVGGNSIVSMAALKQTFEGLGFDDVRTYINSGNVIFSAGEKDAAALGTRIEKAIERDLGQSIRLTLRNAAALKRLNAAVPNAWANDGEYRCDVVLLWKEIDKRSILKELPINPGVDELAYTPGAVLWRVARKNAGKSKLNRVIGTEIYKKMSIRNLNTIRKLNALVNG